jgi:hypothetical protein
VFSLFLSGSFLTFDLQLLIADDYSICGFQFSTIDYFIALVSDMTFVKKLGELLSLHLILYYLTEFFFFYF